MSLLAILKRTNLTKLFGNRTYSCGGPQAEQPKKWRVKGPSGYADHPPGGYKIYKMAFLFVGFPAITAAAVNAYNTTVNEDHHRVPFVPYEHLRRRTKRFPWGEGVKSLFHNKHTNPLPDGYEEEEEDEE